MKTLEEYKIELQTSFTTELLKEVLFYYKDSELLKEYCLLDSTSIDECYELLHNDIYSIRPILLQKISTTTLSKSKEKVYELLLKTPHCNHEETVKEYYKEELKREYEDASNLYQIINDRISSFSIDFSFEDSRMIKLQILIIIEEWKKNGKLFKYCYYLYEKLLLLESSGEIFVSYFRLMNMHQQKDSLVELLYRALCLHKDNADLYYFYYILIVVSSSTTDGSGELFHSDEYLKQNLLSSSSSSKKLYDYQRILFLKYSILLKKDFTKEYREEYLKVLDRELSVDSVMLKYALLLLQLGLREKSVVVAKKCGSKSTNGFILSAIMFEYNLLKDNCLFNEEYIQQVFLKEYCNVESVLKDKKIVEGLQEHADKLLMYHEVFSSSFSSQQNTTFSSSFHNLLEIYRLLDFKTPSKSRKFKELTHITKEDRTIVLFKQQQQQQQQKSGSEFNDLELLEKVLEKKFGKVQEIQKRIEGVGKYGGFNCTFQFVKSCNDAIREGRVQVQQQQQQQDENVVVEFSIEKFNKVKQYSNGGGGGGGGNRNQQQQKQNNKRPRVEDQQQKRKESHLKADDTSRKPKNNDDFRKMFF